jgi:uncharacterized protein (DUF362 family)
LTQLVAVHRSEATEYSQAWKDADEFPEKEQLRAIGELLGKPRGNPFHGVVEPGQNVVVKPNWVLDFHPNGDTIDCVITHAAMLRAAVDLIYEELGGDGSIVIADAPQFNTNFEHLREVTEIDRIPEHFERKHGFEVAIRDLRKIATVGTDAFIKSSDRVPLAGDPEGYAAVDFGTGSAFVGLHGTNRIYGADYDRQETLKHHNAERHEYLVSRTILKADTVVHVPKLKVHKKVGVTLNAKGMVGINGDKNWIAHYRLGPPKRGGDEFPDTEPTAAKARAYLMRSAIEKLLVPETRSRERVFDLARSLYRATKPLQMLAARGSPELEDVVKGDNMLHGGNWHGNDTAWRMTADLGRAVLFADADGRVHERQQRRFFSILDGIVAGENEGPLAPDPRRCGVLVAGENLLAVDLVGTRVMGFDWRRIRYQRWLLDESPQDFGVHDPKADIEVVSNVPGWASMMTDDSVETFDFVPHPGWRGQIELKAPVAG